MCSSLRSSLAPVISGGARCYHSAVVCSYGTWMAPSVFPRASDRRLEGERDGSSSRGSCQPAAARSPAMAAGSLPAFSGSRPKRSPARGEGKAKEWHGTQDAADAGAERQPVTRAQALHRLPVRHPRSRRTLAGAARRGWDVGWIKRPADQPYRGCSGIALALRYARPQPT
jgi:hypothetical protein